MSANSDPVPEVMAPRGMHGVLDPQQARPYKKAGKNHYCYTCKPKTLACAKFDNRIAFLREKAKFEGKIAKGYMDSENLGLLSNKPRNYFPSEEVDKARAQLPKTMSEMQGELNKRKARKCKGRGDLKARRMLHDKNGPFMKGLNKAGAWGAKQAGSKLLGAAGAGFWGKQILGPVIGDAITAEQEALLDAQLPAYGED